MTLGKLLKEGKKGKPTKAEMKKLGSMLKKTYNAGKVVSFNYVEAGKSSYIVYELEKHTLVLQKQGSMGGDGDKGGVSMGIYANKKPSDIDFSNAWNLLGTSDNIYAYQQSGVGGRELLNPAVEAFASDILGVQNEL